MARSVRRPGEARVAHGRRRARVDATSAPNVERSAAVRAPSPTASPAAREGAARKLARRPAAAEHERARPRARRLGEAGGAQQPKAASTERRGQHITTLSGGERQRLKLATHMGEEGGVYVLDELTTGLHLADLEQLLALLDRLVDSGKSVIVIEHHQVVMAHADWIIDLGPGAGHEGGRVVFEGTPADLVAAKKTLTGKHLAGFVGGGGKAVPSARRPSAEHRQQRSSQPR